eukprot:1013710-Prorocentrum_minimum.AAC.3
MTRHFLCAGDAPELRRGPPRLQRGQLGVHRARDFQSCSLGGHALLHQDADLHARDDDKKGGRP